MVRKTSGNPLRSLLTKLLAAEKNATSWPVAVSTGLSDWAFPGSPVEETLTSAVACVQPVLNPLQVFRTNTLSIPFVFAATRFEAREENATNCAVFPMFGDSHNPFAGDVPSDATETSEVEGVQTLPWPVHRSRKYISCTGVAGAPGRFIAVEANAMNLPFTLIFGSMLAPPANAVPSGVEINWPELGVQPEIPLHSFTAYTSCAPPEPVTMFVAVEVKVTICPNRPEATDGWPLAPSAAAPALEADIRVVEGVQDPPAFRQVSRKYTSGVPVVAVETRLVAVDTKATNLPSALIATCELGAFAGLTPSLAMDTRLTAGVHPEGTPAQVLEMKT